MSVTETGQHGVQSANGSDIRIDGGAQLTQEGGSLLQVLDGWMAYGNPTVNVASIGVRLGVTYNRLWA